jgi:hypothetical protein
MASTPSTRRQHDGVAVSSLTDRFSPRAHRSRASTALAAARKKTEDMTEEEKAAETALNQQLLVAKGVLFLGVIGYFAFTSL